MKLTELFLNRFLYKDNSQNLETKDSAFIAADSTPTEPVAISSGGAAQDINTGNVTINGGQLTPGTYPITVLDIANWGWGQTCVFSSVSSVKVDWGSGAFKSADGTSYAISAGTTGTMSAKTYIYFDVIVSPTTYQITTVPGNAVGIGKVLIAVAQNSSSGNATWNLNQATQIVGDNILANSINASKITTGQLIVGTNVGLGTAQDSSGVTTIIGNTVTTGFVNALSITAGSVAAENITGTYITGKTVRTATSGARIQMNGSNNHIEYLYDNSVYGSMFVQTYAQGNGIRIESSSTGAEIELIEGSTLNHAYIGFNGLGLTIDSSGNTTFDGNILPIANNTNDLGSSSYKWKNIYAAGIGYINTVRSFVSLSSLSTYPGAASSWPYFMYFDTTKTTIVFSDGVGWFKVVANSY